MATKATWFTVVSVLLVISQSLIVQHDFKAGMKPFSYQTFPGIEIYATNHSNKLWRFTPMPISIGQSYVDFNLIIENNIQIPHTKNAFYELIVTPNANINEIGFKQNGNLHLCCNPQIFGMYDCDEEHLGQLIIPKRIQGLYRKKISFDPSYQTTVYFQTRVPISVSSFYEFALATCDSTLAQERYMYGNEPLFTFEGTSKWTNSYGSLSGDLFGCLQFYGWMSVIYSFLLIFWIAINKCLWFHKKSKHLFVCSNAFILILLSLSIVYVIFRYYRFFKMNSNDFTIKSTDFDFRKYNMYDIFGLFINSMRGIVSMVMCIGFAYENGGFKLFKSLSNMNAIMSIVAVIIYWISIMAVTIYSLDFHLYLVSSEVQKLTVSLIVFCALFGVTDFRLKELRRKKLILKQIIISFYETIRKLFIILLLIIIVWPYKNIFGSNKFGFQQWKVACFSECSYEISYLSSLLSIMWMLRKSMLNMELETKQKKSDGNFV